MDHATAHERIADLALEAGSLARLASSDAADDRALLDHVRTCDACRADVAASQALSDGLRHALADLPAAAWVEPIAAPLSLRAAILDATRSEPRTGRPRPHVEVDPGSRRRRWVAGLTGLRPAWAAGLAAALTIALLGGLAGAQLQRIAGSGDDPVVAVVATLNRVLAADGHRVVPLRTAAGAAAGSVAWSRQDFAVLASSLARPPAGKTYRCWLQWSGRSVSIGVMDYAGAIAYWTGSVGDWAAIAFDPGTRFVVTLEATGPAPSAPTTPAVLVADLGT